MWRRIRQFISGVLVAAAGALTVVAPATAADTAPDALVKSTVEDVLGVIKNNRDRKVLLQVAEQKVLPHFDFETMTRLAVGRPWREATPDQRQALQNAFRTLLVNTYTTALSQQDSVDGNFDVKPVQVKPGQKDVTVQSVVKPAGRPPVAVDYRMELKPNGWKVYDVIVENLSLVTNYRGTFADEIAKNGIDGLIRSLQAKNRQVAASG